MNIILLSGGSGKRLWPLSNEVRSKQFLKIFKKDDGIYESMVQRMYRMIIETEPNAKVTIATSENQIPVLRSQLGDAVSISVEPCRRDTFPAIVLAAAYLHDIRGVKKSEIIIVCPVDPYVNIDYFQMLLDLERQVSKREANLVLMGIKPTHPSEKYGYIIPCSASRVSQVKGFKEKPDKSTADLYIEQGALWNGGVFAFELDYILKKAEELWGISEYHWVLEHYIELEKVSFDYAVVEKESKIQVIRFSGKWLDLGTWDTLTEAMCDNAIGNAAAENCENTHVINELQIPLLALGVSNLAIASTTDGILVIDKSKSSRLKEYVPERRPMCEEREWGSYQILDHRLQQCGQNYLIKNLVIGPGRHISYQRHEHRTEIWTIVDGRGILLINGETKIICQGDITRILPGMKHAVMAINELRIVEIQLGDKLTEEDIERFDWEWEKTKKEFYHDSFANNI